MQSIKLKLRLITYSSNSSVLTQTFRELVTMHSNPLGKIARPVQAPLVEGSDRGIEVAWKHQQFNLILKQCLVLEEMEQETSAAKYLK